MAENISGNPIEVNVPANVNVTAGKTNLSTFKKQLAAAQRDMGRAMTDIEKGELKSKIINEAHQQRQAMGLSLYGNASSYSTKKFANEPNPSPIISKFQDIVRPKSMRTTSDLDKEIMAGEREIKFILDSFKMALPKGTTGLPAQQQSAVKNMSRIFNKVKRDEGTELDVQKFYQSAADLKKMYEQDVSTGGMSKKTLQGRLKELQSLEVKFEARAKVSRHDMGPLLAVGQSLVKRPVATAARQLQNINKALANTTTTAMKGAGSPQALANQAAADIARNEALGKAAVKQAVKQAATLQNRVLGIAGLGEGQPISKSFDLQALAIPSIKKTLTNRLAREMRKAGITNLTTGGAGVGGGPINPIATPPPGGPGGMGGNIAGIIANVGKNALTGIASLASKAAGMLAHAATRPLVAAFGQVKSMVKDSLSEGPELMSDMTKMAIPLSLKTGEWASSMQSVKDVFNQLTGDATMMPNEVGKIAFSYTRVAKEARGLVGYLKEISLFHAFTEESLQNIDDMVLEWAQAFNIDIPTGADKIAAAMTTIASMTDVSVPEMRNISAWLTPIFSQQKDTEKALRDEMALSGLLAQRGSKLPIMVRGMQGAISSLQTPSNSMLGLFASMDLSIYKMKDGTTGWANTYKAAGKQLKELYGQQNRLNKAAAQGMGGPEWSASNQAITDQIKQQEEYLAGMFSTWQDGGLIVDDTLGALSELSKLMDNPGTQARFLKELKGSSRDSFLQLLKTVNEARRLSQFTKEQGTNVNDTIKKALEGTSNYQATKATSGRKLLFATLEQQLLEPLRVPFFKGFAELFESWNKNKDLQKSLENMGSVISAIGNQYITPAIAEFGKLMSAVFVGGPDSLLQIAESSERLKSLVTGALTRLAKTIAPIVTPIGQVVGNLFMLGFVSVLQGDLAKQIGSIMISMSKQVITGLYSQAGGLGKRLISGIFPFAGEIDKASTGLDKLRSKYNIAPERMSNLFSSYSTDKKSLDSPELNKEFGNVLWMKGGIQDTFDTLLKNGMTIDSNTGAVVSSTLALDAFKSRLLDVNQLSMDVLVTKNKAEQALLMGPVEATRRKIAAAMGTDDTSKLEYGTDAWRKKYLVKAAPINEAMLPTDGIGKEFYAEQLKAKNEESRKDMDFLLKQEILAINEAQVQYKNYIEASMAAYDAVVKTIRDGATQLKERQKTALPSANQL